MTFGDHNLARNPLLRTFTPQTGLLTEKKKKKHLAKKTSSADDVYWLELPLYSLKKRDNMWRNYNIAEKYKFWYCILAVVLDSLFFNGWVIKLCKIGHFVKLKRFR